MVLSSPCRRSKGTPFASSFFLCPTTQDTKLLCSSLYRVVVQAMPLVSHLVIEHQPPRADPTHALSLQLRFQPIRVVGRDHGQAGELVRAPRVVARRLHALAQRRHRAQKGARHGCFRKIVHEPERARPARLRPEPRRERVRRDAARPRERRRGDHAEHERAQHRRSALRVTRRARVCPHPSRPHPRGRQQEPRLRRRGRRRHHRRADASPPTDAAAPPRSRAALALTSSPRRVASERALVFLVDASGCYRMSRVRPAFPRSECAWTVRHPGRPVRQPDRRQVLGGRLRRARHRPDRHVPRRLGPPARAHQRLLQRGDGRPLRAARHPDGPRARHHGLGPLGPLRPDLPPGQLRLRPDGRGQQLGQGPLHRGRRAHRLGPRRRAQGGRVLRLPPGLPG